MIYIFDINARRFSSFLCHLSALTSFILSPAPKVVPHPILHSTIHKVVAIIIFINNSPCYIPLFNFFVSLYIYSIHIFQSCLTQFCLSGKYISVVLLISHHLKTNVEREMISKRLLIWEVHFLWKSKMRNNSSQ